MDVLWGAWAKEVHYDEHGNLTDIIGIYDTIYRGSKSEFPVILDLCVVLACEAYNEENDQVFALTLEMVDTDTISRLVRTTRDIKVPHNGDPIRWYETATFDAITIRVPSRYYLSASVERQLKHRVPLDIVAPKMYLIDDFGDITAEFWGEDWHTLGGETNDRGQQ